MLHLFAPSSVLDAGDRLTRDMLAWTAALFVGGMAYGLHAMRPTTLDVVLAVDGAPEGAWVRAELQPTDWVGSHRLESCQLVGGRCELRFSWRLRRAPSWPTRHVLVVAAPDEDAWAPLGSVSVTSPNTVPVRVRCGAAGVCRLEG